LGAASDLLLRSYSSIDLVGAADFGRDSAGKTTLGKLTLDTPALRAATAADQVRISAQSLVLTNSTGASSADSSGAGSLTLASTDS
ncbi:hypothetical protein ABTL46_22120, partial [Acinetobacter baumannii]